ncbi:MAG: antibiotic biosynthesis monooxygenase [Acidobacteriaceae bacterium]
MHRETRQRRRTAQRHRRPRHPTRSEPVCITYEFHTVEGKPGTFIAFEQWVSQEALDAHVKTAPLQAFIARSGELLQAPFESGLRPLHPLRPQPK